MSAILRFPDFRYKAFTLSYDDGTVHDKRLSDMFFKHGVRATFNISASLLGKDGRLTEEEVREYVLDRGFELACHGYRHYSLSRVDNGVAAYDVVRDRAELESRLGIIIKGMAYANGSYDADVARTLSLAGLEHCRTTVSTEDFTLPEDMLTMPATCHHRNERLFELADKFLNEPQRDYYWAKQPRLFYVWGHSVEFDREGNWDRMEQLLTAVGGREDVWYATVGQICEYITAYRRLRFSIDGSMIHNPSAIPVYVYDFGKDIVIAPGQTVKVGD